MSDNDYGARSGAVRLDRTQRCPGAEGYPARVHVDETRVRVGSAQRKAHRKTYPKNPPLAVSELVRRLPDPIIHHDIDDVCRETMLIVDLLDNDAIDIA